jgi:hypothetical protein
VLVEQGAVEALDDAVRIMRNLAHNACLAHSIRERAANRRNAVVNNIMDRALKAARKR